jgi:predicted transcriptional regulator
MLAAFVEEKKLSPEKITRLRQILDQKGAGLKDEQRK